jgi:tRNA (guanine-N7-)-methyltransferase
MLSQRSPHPGPLPQAGEGGERCRAEASPENPSNRVSPAPADESERRRSIRSYVLRQGRFTPAQQRAFGEHWARYGLAIADGVLDAPRVFGRRVPLVLEIGFGNGEQLLASAQHEADKDFVGIEVHRPGVGRLMNALASRNVDNVRLYNEDAVAILESSLAAASVAEVRIYFPDPWPKKRQQKRRLIQPAFTELLADRTMPGGVLHLATDWADYAEHMHAVLAASPRWRNRAGAARFVERPAWRTETHFEQRGRRLGHGVWDLLYDRC